MSRKLFVPCLFVTLLAVCACTSLAQEGVTVTLDAIHVGDRIEGRVSGLTQAGTRTQKVVVYVKTDRWYLHPYRNGGAGRAWAEIEPDGSWRIETVQRNIAADEIAALVVDRDARVPAEVANLQYIQRRAIVHRVLTGTEDCGKL